MTQLCVPSILRSQVQPRRCCHAMSEAGGALAMVGHAQQWRALKLGRIPLPHIFRLWCIPTLRVEILHPPPAFAWKSWTPSNLRVEVLEPPPTVAWKSWTPLQPSRGSPGPPSNLRVEFVDPLQPSRGSPRLS